MLAARCGAGRAAGCAAGVTGPGMCFGTDEVSWGLAIAPDFAMKEKVFPLIPALSILLLAAR